MSISSVSKIGIEDFVRHLRFSGPFEWNRVSEIANEMPPNVAEIHAAAFEQLKGLIQNVRRRGGMGLLLWGEAGVGKSHLLARLFNELRESATITCLHNVQTSADRLPRYVLKCVLGQLASGPSGRLYDGSLYQLLISVVHRALGTNTVSASLGDAYAAFRRTYVEPAMALHHNDEERIYELLFAYLRILNRGWKTNDPMPADAVKILRWLSGDALDPEELQSLPLPPHLIKQSVLELPDDQGVKTVLAVLSKLAGDADQTFVILFDQVDNLDEHQIAAWARFAHALIDHVPNLAVVTSGVSGRIIQLQESGVINPASWDRLAERRVEIGRITPSETHALLQTRLQAFIEPFRDLPELKQAISDDSLFPLGQNWLRNRIGNALDIRPRDAINWAQQRTGEVCQAIRQVGFEAWLRDYDIETPFFEPGQGVLSTRLTESDRHRFIDSRTEAALVEQKRRRHLDPASLPPDASNFIGLVNVLLRHCLDRSHGYSLRQVNLLNSGARGKASPYDLLVEEESEDGKSVTTGVRFIATGSKQSCAASLRQMINDQNPPDHVLLVTDQRQPLPLGPRGTEYLEQLTDKGSQAFSCREQTFEEHLQLDAMQAVVGLATSADLEFLDSLGNPHIIDPEEVVDSYHRQDLFLRHPLLRELLTEEAIEPVKVEQPLDDSPIDETLEKSVLETVSAAAEISTAEICELLRSSSEHPEVKDDRLQERIDRIVVGLHQSGVVVAAPLDNRTFVSLPKKTFSSRDSSGANTGNGNQRGPSTYEFTESAANNSDYVTPIRFSVSQVRQAAACARLMYFDAEYTRRNRLKNPRVTQIWQVSDPNEIGALGKLFHNSIERFHDSAAQSKFMRRLLESRPNGEVLSKTLQQSILDQNVDRGRLSRALPGQQANFQNALRLYTDELSEMLLIALAEGSQVAEVLDQMFGDRRRSVDVTFDVGPNGRQVNVVGRLDHVFYDWRRDRRRIIDFKLTPGQSIEADLYQVSIYALMHHQQHGTQPDAGLLYLYPEKKLYELSWNEISSRRQEIHDLLASMVQWQEFQFQPRRGLHPPGNSNYCPACTYATICQRQLGAPNIGEVLSGTATTAVGKGETETAVNVGLGSSLSEQDEKTTALQAVEPPVEDCAKSVESETLGNETSGDNLQANSGTGLENSDNEALLDASLLIGHNDFGQTVHLPVQVLPSHVAVVGASGSGKTWMAKVVVEEAIRKGIPVVAVDPQGDLVQFLRKANEDSEHFQDLCEEYTRMVEPRVFTPGTSHGRRLSISPIRVSNNLQRAGMKESRQLEERAMMLASLASNLVNLANAGSDGDLQQTFLTKVIERLTSTSNSSYSELSLKDLVSAIMAPENIGIDDVDLYLAKSQRTKLGRKLMTLIEGPRAGLFSGGEPLNMDSLCRPSTPGKIPLNVIYLNAMNDDTEKQMFVAMLATEIYRWMTSSLESTGQARVLLYFDEARDFIPSGTRRPAAKDPLIRLFAQGRKYGVACLLCTQSPRSVDYNVFSNCSTKLIGRLESSQDVERVAEWFSNDGGRPSWIAQRKSAAPGTFVARWPGMSQQQTGVCFKGRPLFSLHEGAWSPTRVESEIAQSSELSCVE